MKRRDFYKNLLGASAAVAIAPKLFDQIVEQQYETPKGIVNELGLKTTPFDNTGLWVFQDDILIGYGGINGVNLRFERPMIEVTSIEFDTIDFLSGKLEGTWEIDDMQFLNDVPYQLDSPVHIVFTTPEHGTIESDAFLVNRSTVMTLDGHSSHAEFRLIGEATIT